MGPRYRRGRGRAARAAPCPAGRRRRRRPGGVWREEPRLIVTAASSWRLLTGRLAPRFRHRSYSTTSEEPPLHISTATGTSPAARSRLSAPGPPPRARFVPAQTGGGDGDPPGRGVRCPGHPPHREATARIAKHPFYSPAGGHGAGRPVSPGATGSARPRRVPRWPRRCSARPSARFSTPRRASRRWWTRRAR